MLKVILLLSALAASDWASAQSMAAVTAPTRAPLRDHELRALLIDNYVHRGGDDGPGEFFDANGAYRRDGGHGAIVFEGWFEIRDDAVCVLGGALGPVCRRVVDNGDSTYTFINIADGTTTTMMTLRPR